MGCRSISFYFGSMDSNLAPDWNPDTKVKTDRQNLNLLLKFSSIDFNFSCLRQNSYTHLSFVLTFSFLKKGTIHLETSNMSFYGCGSGTVIQTWPDPDPHPLYECDCTVPGQQSWCPVFQWRPRSSSGIWQTSPSQNPPRRPEKIWIVLTGKQYKF